MDSRNANGQDKSREDPWDARLGQFVPASPSLAQRRELQRRTESKFVMPVAAAVALLPELTADYAILDADTARVAAYHTLYFDTADLEFFHAHRRGRRLRQKVRIRHYPDRRVSFLEVKMRISDDRTTKVRRERCYGDNELRPIDLEFVRAHSTIRQAIVPQAWIDYRRVTLLGMRTEERVTFDFDLRMTHGSRAGRLQDVAVVEVKQSRMDRDTAIMVALRKAGWRAGWASKYCAAVVLTSPEVRAHRLLEGLRALRAVGTWAN